MEWLEEAWRNLSVKQLVLALATALATFLSTLWASVEAADAITLQRDRVTAGATIWRIEAAISGEHLPTASCQMLDKVPGVFAGGAVSSSLPLSTTHQPQPLAVLDITPGLLRLWPASGEGPLIVGSEYEALGRAGLGSMVGDGHHGARITGRLSAPQAPKELHAAVLRVTKPHALDFCWVQLPPGSAHTGPALAKWAFASSPTVVKPYLPPPQGRSAQEQWEAFAGSCIWLSPALLAALAGVAIGIARRKEIALIRTLGASLGDILSLVSLEMLLFLPLYLAAGAAALLVGYQCSAAHSPDVIAVAVRLGTATAITALVSAILTCFAVQSGRALSGLKG